MVEGWEARRQREAREIAVELRSLFAALMLVNLASAWLRGRSTGLMSGFYLVGAGALAIFVFKLGLGWENAAIWGVALTLAGSLLSALDRLTNACTGLWRELFTRARFLIGRGHKQGD